MNCMKNGEDEIKTDQQDKELVSCSGNRENGYHIPLMQQILTPCKNNYTNMLKRVK